MEIRSVQAAGFAEAASAVLSASWAIPSVHYSPEYLAWQLSFPGVPDPPAVAAFDGDIVTGFAATTPRRVRRAHQSVDILIVSFVAVRPEWRNRGMAAELYRALLAAVTALRMPAITFATAGSAGQRTIEAAYPAAGFALRSLGAYPGYAAVGGGSPATTWIVSEPGEVSHVVEQCCLDEDVWWSDPTAEQLDHYLRDPRGRRLVTSQSEAAAWVVTTEYVGPHGVERVNAMDSVWLARDRVEDLAGLASIAGGPIVNAPNLVAMDPARLRSVGFRRVSAGFVAYAATPPGAPEFSGGRFTNLEIV